MDRHSHVTPPRPASPVARLARLTLLAALLVTAFVTPARAALRVVTTTPDLAALTKAVAGPRASVVALALPSQDPHFVDARPHLALDLAKADLLIVVGADLEVGWLPTLLTGARNGRIQSGAAGYLDASTLIGLLDAPSGKVDRSQGDVHPHGSPHFLLDPRRAERIAIGIGKKLAELDPAGHASYLAATKAFVTDLRARRASWEARLAGLRGKPIVAYHRSLSYLADWLALDVIEHLEPRPGIPPTPGHVARVIEQAQARKVRLLLQEAWYPMTTSQLAAQKMGAKLVVLPGSADFAAGQSYAGFLESIVKKLESAS